MKIGIIGKQFIFLFVFIAGMISFLGYINYRDSQRMLESISYEESRLLAEKINQYLNLYQDTIKNILFLMQIDEENFLPQSDEARIATLRKWESLNADVISAVYYLGNDGKLVSSHPAHLAVFGEEFLYTQFDPLSQAPGLEWTDPYYNQISGLTVSCRIKLEQGSAIVDANLPALSKILTDYARGNKLTVVLQSPRGKTAILDEASPMIELEEKTFPFDLSSGFKEKLAGLRDKTGRIELKGASVRVYSSKDNNLNWNIFVLTHESVITDRLREFNGNYVQVLLVILAILPFSSIALSWFLTRPIRNIVHQMDRVTSLHGLIPIKNTYSNEVGHLVESYNALMQRIDTLSDEKHSLEIEMLRNQIRPHFLYNTLTCIGSLAYQGKSRELNTMINSLIQLLRFSFDKSKARVSLREELEVLSQYIIIQNTRYGNRIEFHQEVPQSLLSASIPALLLQPIVENSIFHGIEAVDGKLKITVSCKEVGKAMRINICDTGKPLSPEELAGLSSPGERQTIGLSNTINRIRTNFGDEAEVQLKRNMPKGLCVSLLLPIRRIATPRRATPSIL